MQNTNHTLSLAVMSGKGGVGKTNLALSLGYSLFKAGHPLMLMDCDLGLANVDVLLGLSFDKTLQDLLRPEVEGEDVVVTVEEGFDFLPAASGVPELVEMDEDMQALLFKKLTSLMSNYEYLIMDLGAGINSTVTTMGSMAQFRIVVVTPEPTSLTDSYALMKVLHSRHGTKDFNIVVNMASSKKEAENTFKRLQAACKQFLGLNINYLGMVHQDRAVVDSVIHQVPLIKHAPQSKAGKDILSTALKIENFRNDNLELLENTPILRNFPVNDQE